MHTCLCSRCSRYAHVCVWTHMCSCICAYIQRPKIKVQYLSLYYSHYFLRHGFSRSLELANCVGWLVSKLQRSVCLQLSSAGVQAHIIMSDYVFPWVLGFPIGVSKLVHQALYWPSHFSRPLYHSLSDYYTAIVTLMIKFYYSSKHIDHKILKHELKSLI